MKLPDEFRVLLLVTVIRHRARKTTRSAASQECFSLVTAVAAGVNQRKEKKTLKWSYRNTKGRENPYATPY